MAMTQEEQQDFKDSLSLLSAEELRGQMGDDPEADALIQSILDTGKAVELKTPKVAGAEGEDDASSREGTHHSMGDGDDDDNDDDDNTPPADPAAAPADPAAAAAAAAAAEPAPAADNTAAALSPLDLSYLDGKFDEKLVALDAAKATQFKAMMDGDLAPEDYAKFESQYLRDRDGLRDERVAEAAWATTVHSFKVQALATSGINYETDAEKAQSFDDWLKRLADKPENASLNEEQFLALAHKKVMTEYDITPTGKPAPAAPPVAQTKQPEKQKGRSPDLSNIPPTLGALPAASSEDASSSGEFARLDNLTGIAYELALAALTSDQKARYEAM